MILLWLTAGILGTASEAPPVVGTPAIYGGSYVSSNSRRKRWEFEADERRKLRQSIERAFRSVLADNEPTPEAEALAEFVAPALSAPMTRAAMPKIDWSALSNSAAELRLAVAEYERARQAEEDDEEADMIALLMAA